MEWTIDYREKDKIVSVKTSGTMDWESHEKFCREVFTFAIKHGSHKVLIDFREMVPNFTILQIDDLPELLRECGVGPEFRIAALHDPKSPKANEFDFFRNVATLFSIQVRHFADRKEAVAWLKSQN